MKYRYYNLKTGVKRAKTKLAIALSVLGLGAGGVIASLAFFGAAHAATPSYSLFDAASTVTGGDPGYAVQMVSDSTSTTPDGGINFSVPSGMTFSQLNNLATEYKITTGDCGGGSPRFQVNIGAHNVFVYLGPSPNYTGCTPSTWIPSGNLTTSPNPIWDTSQYPGGNFYSTYADAETLLGNDVVTGIQLVTDGGWAVTGGVQTVLADNTQINSNTYDYTPLVTVTIAKYLNGVPATAASANSTAFPMQSSWSATNIGTGSGSYTLSPSGFNNPNPYQATTSDMTAGATYSTNEVTTGNIVGDSCSSGDPYKLVGYSTGTSLTAAETGTKSTNYPTLNNITQNEYIIVWNLKCATGQITSPTAGQHVNGTLHLAATYNDGDTPNTDDGVQWAVRQATCAAGTNTVFGNVDGHHDGYSWDGNSFSADLNISALPYGSYCFVFNPTDDPGQPDVRLTQTFNVDVGPPTNKDQCRQDGWKTFNVPEVFKNQGQCISYVEHHSHRVNGDDLTYSAYGLTRHAEFNMNTANNSGWFVYWDANHDWYYVKVSDVKVSGNTAYFAGEVMKSKDNHYNGNWLFAEVKTGHPNQIWGSFTSQSTATTGVMNMSNPGDGPFDITHGHLSIH